MVKMESEIYKYFFRISSSFQNIWHTVLGLCSTRPQNLIHIQPEAIDFFCKFRSCS